MGNLFNWTNTIVLLIIALVAVTAVWVLVRGAMRRRRARLQSQIDEGVARHMEARP